MALLEDNELFNCGRGAVFTREGGIELEASVSCEMFFGGCWFSLLGEGGGVDSFWGVWLFFVMVVCYISGFLWVCSCIVYQLVQLYRIPLCQLEICSFHI